MNQRASTAKRAQKLEAYYDSFVQQQEILKGLSGNTMLPRVFAPLDDEVKRAKAEFPELIPEYPDGPFGYSPDWRRYDAISVELYLAKVVARFRGALKDTLNTPIPEPMEFAFITNPKLRRIIERDNIDIRKAQATESWKSVILLSGGSIEAILLDLLLRNETAAKAASCRPKKNLDLHDWGLSDLIKVAVELEIVTKGVETLSQTAREYRNLVHPGNECLSKLTVSKLDANSAWNALMLVHRELSAKS
jgi:hypothetical protein